MLRGVARGVAGGGRDVAQGDRVPVDQTLGLEAVLPVLAALARDIGGCAGRRRQLPGSGEEVRVDVGLGHGCDGHPVLRGQIDRKSTRLNSSHVAISYAVFCLKKKNKKYIR